MQTRKTARALLFDAEGRLLLVRMHDPQVADADGKVVERAYWVTIGGEIDEGEDVMTAVRREIAEETGLTEVRLGAAVWYAEHVLMVKGEPRLFQETFVLAYTEDTNLSRAGWTEEETQVIEHLKWWEMDDLFASGDTFFPSSLKENLLPLTDDLLPPTMLTIEP
ncbi:MAG: NUDIX domain-containing protein [Parvibaculum sp.]|nr:NUDIX domain-containing protein [Parvibaculum sp.]|tara:strand:- start:596 stop:1090 length:495 start_codon:yes stop_codon:yes gene_type:complete